MSSRQLDNRRIAGDGNRERIVQDGHAALWRAPREHAPRQQIAQWRLCCKKLMHVLAAELGRHCDVHTNERHRCAAAQDRAGGGRIAAQVPVGVRQPKLAAHRNDPDALRQRWVSLQCQGNVGERAEADDCDFWQWAMGYRRWAMGDW